MTRLLRYLFSLEEDFRFDPTNCRKGLELLVADNTSRVLVAEHGGKVVAMCTGQQNVSTASGGISLLVEDVVVEENMQGLGIMSSLLDNLSDWACRNGIKRMQLLTDKNNTPALRFYASRDWQSTQLICLKKTL